jgi:hypothetical protein
MSFLGSRLVRPINFRSHIVFIERRMSRLIFIAPCKPSLLHLTGKVAHEYAEAHPCPRPTYPAREAAKLPGSLRKWINSTKTHTTDPNLRATEVRRSRMIQRARTIPVTMENLSDEHCGCRLWPPSALFDRLVSNGKNWSEGLTFPSYAFMKIGGALPNSKLPEEIWWDKGDKEEVAYWERELKQHGLGELPGIKLSQVRRTTQSRPVKRLVSHITGEKIWAGLPFVQKRDLEELRPFPKHWEVTGGDGWYIVVVTGNNNQRLMRLELPRSINHENGGQPEPPETIGRNIKAAYEAARQKLLGTATKEARSRYQSNWRKKKEVRIVTERINQQLDKMATIYFRVQKIAASDCEYSGYAPSGGYWYPIAANVESAS